MINRIALFMTLCLSVWGCSSSEPEGAQQAAQPHAEAPAELEAQELDVAALKNRLDAGADLFLLDVRRPDELAEHGLIAGAVNIPIDELESRLAEVPRDKPVVTYCMGGGRASRAARILREAGYDQPIEYGGITAWKEAGYEVVSPTP